MRWLALALSLLCTPVLAHKPSDSYLTLRVHGNQIEGQWDIALRDLDYAIGLDRDHDSAVTWDEVRARHADIATYALARLSLSKNGEACAIKATEHLIDRHSDGTYTVLRFASTCPANAADAAVEVKYGLFFDLDPQHRGLLKIELAGTTQSAVFSPDQPTLRFDGGRDRWRQAIDFVREGIWHIWTGTDHILFLLALLLPSVLRRDAEVWRPVADFGHAFKDVFKIVTAFTVAHSITLSLAALQIVSLPSRWVESAIAASVVVAALNNVYPITSGRRWTLAFAFGLLHGFGFASVLNDIALPSDALVLSLLSFNVGVELGQLVIVAIFLPLAYMARASWFYRRLTLLGGSLLVAAVALIWLIERAANVRVLDI